jgi:hypothetical protein
MLTSREGMPRRSGGRRWSAGAGLAVLALIASTGCQVEYAGMTLPSGKYMHDDVQYFAPGPEFPYANTQAATQRARMQAAGMPLPPVPGSTAVMGPAGTAAGAGGGLPGGAGMNTGPLPQMAPMPEAEADMPGGVRAPNAPTPPVPGGAVTPPQ